MIIYGEDKVSGDGDDVQSDGDYEHVCFAHSCPPYPPFPESDTTPAALKPCFAKTILWHIWFAIPDDISDMKESQPPRK